MSREGEATKCINGDGAGDFDPSVTFQHILPDRRIKWTSSAPRTPQRNVIAALEVKQLMLEARSQSSRGLGLRGEKYSSCAVAGTAFITGGMSHEDLGGETPCAILTGKPFNNDGLSA